MPSQGPKAGQVGEAAVPDEDEVSTSDSDAGDADLPSEPEDSEDEQRCSPSSGSSMLAAAQCYTVAFGHRMSLPNAC